MFGRAREVNVKSSKVMISVNNYFQRVQGVQMENLPEQFFKGHLLVKSASQNNWELYNSNPDIKRTIDLYFLKLEEYLDNNIFFYDITLSKKPSKIKRFIFNVIFFPAFVLVLKSLARISQERQQAKRYKKVIKKGLFWDTEYLIERD